MEDEPGFDVKTNLPQRKTPPVRGFSRWAVLGSNQ
jgi:hypothetical protein